MSLPVLKISDAVYIDEKRLDYLKAIHIDSKVGQVSEVTITLSCKVLGVEKIAENNKKEVVIPLTIDSNLIGEAVSKVTGAD